MFFRVGEFKYKRKPNRPKAVEKYKITEGHIPDVPIHVGYHRECYMQYANKRNIERASKKKEKTVQEAEGL